jgi:hypothetical protein
MSGAIPSLPQYAFMTRSVKAQRQLYLYIYLTEELDSLRSLKRITVGEDSFWSVCVCVCVCVCV